MFEDMKEKLDIIVLNYASVKERAPFATSLD